jgi:hypothetical protein
MLRRGQVARRSTAPATRATYPSSMSVAESPHESSDLIVVSAKEAVERAKPLPSDDDMAVEGLTDDEWDAFERAIADQ